MFPTRVVRLKATLFNHKISNGQSNINRRLQQLLEENSLNKDDPLIKISHGIVEEDKQLTKIYEKLPEKEYQAQFKGALSVLGVHGGMNKHSKDIAMRKPWDGEETIEESSRRMLNDSLKPLRTNYNYRNVSPNNSMPARLENQNIRSAKSKKIVDRIVNVQDSVIKYQQDRDGAREDKASSEFRALYAERFTPIGSFEKIQSLADARIEESMRNGGFDNVKKLHGMSTKIHNSNPYLDRTEHHLNNILSSQNIVPPWIEKQGGVNKDIERFRKDILQQFERDLLFQLNKLGVFDKSFDDLSTAMDDIGLNLDHFLDDSFARWKMKTSAIIDTQVNALNNQLRSYNLQAPLSTQKLYLISENELQRVRSTINPTKLYRDEKKSRELTETSSRKNASTKSFYDMFKIW